MKTVTVNIVTPDGPVYDAEVEMIIAKTTSGEIGVLPGHIPMVAPLAISVVKLKREGRQEVVAVSGGFIEVRPEKVSILAPSAEVADSIDVQRAKEAVKRAESHIQAKQDNDDFQRAQLALKRALNRINAHEGNY